MVIILLLLSQPISLNDGIRDDGDISVVHGHPNFYKQFVSRLTVEQARIGDNIFTGEKEVKLLIEMTNLVDSYT